MTRHRYTAEEKGKAVAHNSSSQETLQRKRIRAPEIDTSNLIEENRLTLIGRILNPKEQPIGVVISALPRKWNIKGGVSGSDLGQNCFQFRFELEEDINTVLEDRPYHYNHWMLVLQKWEPIISPRFPSQIPFWISLQGIPLHFWHKSMIDNICLELGTLVDYKISKTSAKVCVLIDALKPLLKESIIEFSTGEELPLTLEYEDLEYHCTTCFSLSHVARNCPMATGVLRTSPSRSRSSLPSVFPPLHTTEGNALYHQRSRDTSPHRQATATEFSKRLDRHGRPFGDRLALPPIRGRPITNKIIPHSDSMTMERRDRESHRPQNEERAHHREAAKLNYQRSSTPVWREKSARTIISPPQDRVQPRDSSPTSPVERPPLERNLAIHDFPQPHGIPTREEVMNELREVTFQYTNCQDPVESAAR